MWGLCGHGGSFSFFGGGGGVAAQDRLVNFTRASSALVAGTAHAADFVETGKCLFANCPGALASCLTDKTCVENLVCLQNCNDRPDESECQAGSSKALAWMQDGDLG